MGQSTFYEVYDDSDSVLSKASIICKQCPELDITFHYLSRKITGYKCRRDGACFR